MLKCAQGHENPDNARFCGVCGEGVSVPAPPDDPELQEEINAADPTDPSDEIADDIASPATDDPINIDTDSSTQHLDSQISSPLADDVDETELTVDSEETVITPSGGDEGDSLSYSMSDMIAEITSWSDRHDLSIESDPYLGGLVSAVTRRDDLTMWASLSPFEHLPKVSRLRRNSAIWERVSSFVFVLRNVLVFVPVALTWLAISEAVDAFGTETEALRGQGQDTTANFLDFWQSSDSWWRIGHVAFFDFILISTIVLFTLIHSATSTHAERIQSKSEEIFSREREVLGFKILASLQGKRQANPESIAESLAEALNDLTQAARDVNEVASRLERASTGVESLAPQIDALNVRVRDLVSTFNSGLVGSMDHFADSVNSLDRTVAGGVAKLFEETVIGIQEINEQLARTGASIEFGTKQLRDDLDAIHSRLSSVAKGSR